MTLFMIIYLHLRIYFSFNTNIESLLNMDKKIYLHLLMQSQLCHQIS